MPRLPELRFPSFARRVAALTRASASRGRPYRSARLLVKTLSKFAQHHRLVELPRPCDVADWQASHYRFQGGLLARSLLSRGFSVGAASSVRSKRRNLRGSS